MKGLLVSIYKNGRGDCSNGGLSSHATQAILVGRHPLTGEQVPEIFEADAKAPAVVLKTRMVGGECYVRAEPVDRPDDAARRVGPMFGGAFIYTSDSRFPEKYPIPLHDRWE